MNILYIEHYAGSPEMGMEFRPYYLSREWVKLGHKVTIFAGDYSHLRKRNPAVSEDFQKETIDGIEYVWLRTGSYEGNGVSRALTMWRFVRKLYTHARMIAKQWKPDVVIASSTYPLDTYPAQRIAKIAGCKYIHEVHDMWPATLYEIGGMSRRNPFVVLMQIAENSAYRHCDKCVSLLPYSKDYMVEHGLDPKKFVNLQNGVVLDEWQNPDPIPDEHRKFFEDHSGSFIVGYFGGHALSNALDKVLDTAKVLQDKQGDIVIVLVGDGFEKERLIQRVKSENITNTFFLPPVSRRAVPTLLSFFDCSIITAIDSPLYRFGVCLNKMYDSMMSGKPTICAINSPLTLIEKYQCGISLAGNDPSEIALSIIELNKMSEEERSVMGKRGRDAVVANFTYEHIASEFSLLFC